ncbi:putative exopolyphosphatase PRUNE1 [Cocos nucifera]|uniref:Putative exopolyphosphatase PRUNE1 n=1 Tax=Cocos nucifera TaxID=13894 RepID=A0A8K0MXT8_COCNU|nr:putative exopolyphosphatase PRUNE1 [Cocos nucifera]
MLASPESKRSAPDITNNDMGSENPGQKVELENPPPLLSGIQSMFGQYSFDKYQSVDDKNLERKLEGMNSGSKQNIGHPRISLPQSAASFYDKNLLQTDVSVLEMCESIDKLNQYLKIKKAHLKAGIPGKFLHAVIGQEVADVGSVVSTIMYAFFLNEAQTSSQLCTLPVINMKRADFSTHSELKWLFRSCRVEEEYLINLSYYDLFGSLKLVLLNGNKLPAKQEGLKEALVEIFNCDQVDSQYPRVKDVTMRQLSGILLDTANLTSANCTSKDKYMATLLIKGAGRFGCNGLYEILKYKMFDISDLKVRDILHRNFKKWTRVTGKPNTTGSRLTVSHIGMSSIGISVEQLLAHEDLAAQEVIQFRESEKLRLLMVVSGYYDNQKNFKREILVSTSTAELMKNFLHFFDTNGTHLPLKSLDQLELKDELRAFEIDNKLTSRRSIERLLEEFNRALRKQ